MRAANECHAHGCDGRCRTRTSTSAAKVIEENGAEFVLRGIGLVAPARRLGTHHGESVDGTPIYLKDIATVQIGGDFRRGACMNLSGP